MEEDAWRSVLVIGLGANALLGFGYRLYRLMKGGPIGDVVGQAILGMLLATLAAAVASGTGWARWVALGYSLLFGLAVMPVWTLAVLIPQRPGGIDYSFAALYWAGIVAIGVAAIAL